MVMLKFVLIALHLTMNLGEGHKLQSTASAMLMMALESHGTKG